MAHRYMHVNENKSIKSLSKIIGKMAAMKVLMNNTINRPLDEDTESADICKGASCKRGGSVDTDQGRLKGKRII